MPEHEPEVNYADEVTNSESELEEEVPPVDSLPLEEIDTELGAMFLFTFPPLCAILLVMVVAVLGVLNVLSRGQVMLLAVVGGFVVAMVGRVLSIPVFIHFPGFGIMVIRLWCRLTGRVLIHSRERVEALIQRRAELLETGDQHNPSA